MTNENTIRIYGMSDLAQAIRIFGYCLVTAAVIPTVIVVTYLNGAG